MDEIEELERTTREGGLLTEQGRPAEALSILEPLLQRHPHDVPLLTTTASAYLSHGDETRALDLAHLATTLAPDRIDPMLVHAMALAAAADASRYRRPEQHALHGDMAQAVAVARNALDRHPFHPGAHLVLAALLLREPRSRQEAISLARRGTQLSDPETAWAHAVLAQTLMADDRIEEAERALRAARRVDPDFALSQRLDRALRRRETYLNRAIARLQAPDRTRQRPELVSVVWRLFSEHVWAAHFAIWLAVWAQAQIRAARAGAPGIDGGGLLVAAGALVLVAVCLVPVYRAMMARGARPGHELLRESPASAVFAGAPVPVLLLLGEAPFAPEPQATGLVQLAGWITAAGAMVGVYHHAYLSSGRRGWL